MECPTCHKIIRVTEEEKLVNGFMRYKCGLCGAWSSQSQRKASLWWLGMALLIVLLILHLFDRLMDGWSAALLLGLSIIFLIVSHTMAHLVAEPLDP